MMAADAKNIDAYKREFLEFLESDDLEGKYIQNLKQCIDNKSYRLIVNINDLRNFNATLANK
jgi:MCM N-terminal domain